MTAAFATTPFESAVANASSYAETRASAVAAGSVLWAFTWQYSATNTCSSVADDLGGTWVKAFGPTRAGTNNGASNASIYGWYKLNSAAGGSPTNGTVTATWSGSSSGGIVIGEITGLAGGGALDAQVSGVVDGIVSDISFGVTPTLAQAVEAAVMFVVAPGSTGLSTPHSPFVADTNIDSFNFERAYRAITTTNAALDAGLTASANVTDVGGLMVFKDLTVAPTSATLTGPSTGTTGAASTNFTVTLDAAATSTVTITPAGTVGSVTFSPSSPTITAGNTTTTFTATPASDGAHVISITTSPTLTVPGTVTYTTSTPSDTTPPTQSGSITIGTVTSTSIQMSWPAGSDNVAVTSYEVSKDAGSNWTDVGNVLTYTFTGLTPSTSYPLRVRAKDAAGNVSTPALAASQSTSAPPSTPTVTITLTTDGSAAASSLSSLKWAFWDYATPDLIAAAPSAKGSAETTNGSGVMVLDVTGTTLSSGQVGWLDVTNSDGNPATNHSAFSGPAAID